MSCPKLDITIGLASAIAVFVKSLEKKRIPPTFATPANKNPILKKFILISSPKKFYSNENTILYEKLMCRMAQPFPKSKFPVLDLHLLFR